MALDLSEIIQEPMPAGQFMDEAVSKVQIVLHHTASGPGSAGDLNTWRTTPEKVATAFVLERSGQLVQTFSSAKWAYHLGCHHHRWPQHDRQSIGIEIDNWGALVKKGSKFYSWTGQEVPADKIQVYAKPWRGSMYFEKYTAEQITALEDLIVYLCKKFKIPMGFDASIFEIKKEALDLVPGIFSHASYRTDKSDAHPQPELLALGAKLKAMQP